MCLLYLKEKACFPRLYLPRASYRRLGQSNYDINMAIFQFSCHTNLKLNPRNSCTLLSLTTKILLTFEYYQVPTCVYAAVGIKALCLGHSDLTSYQYASMSDDETLISSLNEALC